MTQAAMVLKSVSLRLGDVWALREIDLRIHAGERLALVGANGCGKSSLLRILHGLHSPSVGRVERPPQLRQAMLFQRPFLMRLSVFHNVALGVWLAGCSWSQSKSRAHAVLDHLGLSELSSRRATALSTGQQQRVALARAWALQPQALLLDEPTASLDPPAKREVEQLINGLTASTAGRQMTLVFSSHNLAQVRRLASRVIYLENGRILADLPAQDFFNESWLESEYPEALAFVRGDTA